MLPDILVVLSWVPEVLLRAYAGSVALAVKEIGIVEIKEQAGIQIQMSYAQYQEYGIFLKNIILWNSKPTLQIKLTQLSLSIKKIKRIPKLLS